MSTNYVSFWVSTPICQRCSDPSVVVVPRSLLKDAIRLTHPDRHPEERREQANRLTAQLNAALNPA